MNLSELTIPTITNKQITELATLINDADSCPESKTHLLEHSLEDLNATLYRLGLSDKDGIFIEPSQSHPNLATLIVVKEILSDLLG